VACATNLNLFDNLFDDFLLNNLFNCLDLDFRFSCAEGLATIQLIVLLFKFVYFILKLLNLLVSGSESNNVGIFGLDDNINTSRVIDVALLR